jgi:hypothetical protein
MISRIRGDSLDGLQVGPAASGGTGAAGADWDEMATCASGNGIHDDAGPGPGAISQGRVKYNE